MNLFHGIGLRSIRRTLEKYNGTLRFKPDADRFTLTVVIPLQQLYCVFCLVFAEVFGEDLAGPVLCPLVELVGVHFLVFVY